MDNLKPCPFCGKYPSSGVEFFESRGTDVKLRATVYCSECHVSRGVVFTATGITPIPFLDYEIAFDKAKTAWNRRAKLNDEVSNMANMEFQNWEAQEAGELKFGDRVNILLCKKGMTQRELAKAIHMTDVSISRYINNSRVPKGTAIVAIAKALGVSTDVLLGVSEIPEPWRGEEDGPD